MQPDWPEIIGFQFLQTRKARTLGCHDEIKSAATRYGDTANRRSNQLTIVYLSEAPVTVAETRSALPGDSLCPDGKVNRSTDL